MKFHIPDVMSANVMSKRLDLFEGAVLLPQLLFIARALLRRRASQALGQRLAAVENPDMFVVADLDHLRGEKFAKAFTIGRRRVVAVLLMSQQRVRHLLGFFGKNVMFLELRNRTVDDAPLRFGIELCFWSCSSNRGRGLLLIGAWIWGGFPGLLRAGIGWAGYLLQDLALEIAFDARLRDAAVGRLRQTRLCVNLLAEWLLHDLLLVGPLLRDGLLAGIGTRRRRCLLGARGQRIILCLRERPSAERLRAFDMSERHRYQCESRDGEQDCQKNGRRRKMRRLKRAEGKRPV